MTQEKKKRRGRPRLEGRPVCHPERKAYARLDLPGDDLHGQIVCFNCYRNHKFANKYPRTDAIKKYQRKQRILCSIVDAPKRYLPLREIFNNRDYLLKIRQALNNGNREILGIWSELTVEQQNAIKSVDS